jgi:hypothetical protein
MIGASVSSSSPLWRKIEGKPAWRTVSATPAPPVIPQPVPVVPVPDIEPDALPAKTEATVARIIARVAREHGLMAKDITGSSRRAGVLKARRAAMIEALKSTDFSFPRVGRLFGGRDHTTILHAIQRHCAATGETLRGWTPEESREALKRKRIKVDPDTIPVHGLFSSSAKQGDAR